MNFGKLPPWLQAAVGSFGGLGPLLHVQRQLQTWLQAAVGSFGGLGLFLVAFLDSSVLTFPAINDILVIELAIQHPARMLYYALMATLGSLAGCLALFLLAREGGELAFHRHAGVRAEHIRGWMQRNGFLAVLVAAMLPPPTPFKVFVLAAGVCEVPLRTFVLALLLARSVRYFGEGYLAVRYGVEALGFLKAHRVESSVVALALVVGGYLLSRILLPKARPHG